MREEFEKAIVTDIENPEPYLVYADWLIEQGDARGEFVQTQLALESESLAIAEREKLKEREFFLLMEYGQHWLGELGRFIMADASFTDLCDGGEDDSWKWKRRQGSNFLFRRGFLQRLRVRDLSFDYADTLASSWMSSFLTELHLETSLALGEVPVAGWENRRAQREECCFDRLKSARNFDNLRTLTIGEDEASTRFDGAGRVVELLKCCPRLEQLFLYAHQIGSANVFSHAMPFLRELHVFHEEEYPLGLLAQNSSLEKLEVLRIFPHAIGFDDQPFVNAESFVGFGEPGALPALRVLSIVGNGAGDLAIEAIISAGLHRHLIELELFEGYISDNGARALADVWSESSITTLELGRNSITQEGARVLRDAGAPILSLDEWEARSPSDLYLDYQGDIE